jgi:hypothetical protein
MTKRKGHDERLQSARFIEAAKKAEADETGKKFERAFKKIVPVKKKQTKPAER